MDVIEDEVLGAIALSDTEYNSARAAAYDMRPNDLAMEYACAREVGFDNLGFID